MNTFQKIVKEICEDNKITFNILSKDWIITLEKDGKVKYIAGYKFDLNRHGLGLILDDKYAMYDVLNKFNLPIIKHYIVYRDNNLNDYAMLELVPNSAAVANAVDEVKRICKYVSPYTNNESAVADIIKQFIEEK